MNTAQTTTLPDATSIFSGVLSRLTGLSMLASLFSASALSMTVGTGGYVLDSTRLLLLGVVLEAGRRFFHWLIERVRLQFSVTAQFTEGDPTFEWIVVFMTERNIWKRSRDFRVNTKSSIRRWGIRFGGDRAAKESTHVDLVPTYELPHLFNWNGVWIETKRSTGIVNGQPPFGGFSPAVIHLTMYTLNLQALHQFIEDARLCYLEHGRSSVILHSASQSNFGPGFVWNCVKRKLRRPINSIILEAGMIESILEDAREFIEMENWYIDAGIPHRRGYLLHGPPGTGKTSTIHALAGELGLEIFSLSLSASFVDDGFLQLAASSIPKKAIFLIEDIDCAFSTAPRRGDGYGGVQGPGFEYPGSVGVLGGGEYTMGQGALSMPNLRRSNVTLSGLLNVIDGIGSEEGILFFATTNCIERLDPALLRPGRIDRKVQYKLTTKAQAAALFDRFFPAAHISFPKEHPGEQAGALLESKEDTITWLSTLGKKFADNIPDHEFSTAELQGYLLSCKKRPEDAAEGVATWIAQERAERRQKDFGATLAGNGTLMTPPHTPPLTSPAPFPIIM